MQDEGIARRTHSSEFFLFFCRKSIVADSITTALEYGHLARGKRRTVGFDFLMREEKEGPLALTF